MAIARYYRFNTTDPTVPINSQSTLFTVGRRWVSVLVRGMDPGRNPVLVQIQLAAGTFRATFAPESTNEILFLDDTAVDLGAIDPPGQAAVGATDITFSDDDPPPPAPTRAPVGGFSWNLLL